jgi:hypothetical protein
MTGEDMLLALARLRMTTLTGARPAQDDHLDWLGSG